ncbi:MAG: acyl-CoA dehydrogenase family protein [Acidimicrobiia bacterium]
MTALYPPTDPDVRAELVATVRRWVAREVTPIASELEHADEYPHGLVEQMQAMGLFGVTIPEEHGGLGLDLLTYVGVIEEIAYGWMSVTGILNTHTIAATIIARYGADEQRRRWLPGLASGARRGSLSLSEPDAGSDTRNISCRATKDGDEYVVNGTKMWVTNGRYASIVALAARTDEGVSCFIVEKEPGTSSGGITVGENIGKLGYKGVETVEMSYDDHRVPAAALVGEPGRGLTYILSVLELGRVNIAARAVGIAQASLDAALSYAQQRVTMGKPIAQHQAIQMKLADMATKVEASRLLTYSAAEKMQAGERADVEAGMAKLFASETALEVATDSMRIHGGVGYTTDLPIERYFRDAPLLVIGEGTNEIQRLVIARGLLARNPAR